MPYRPLLCLSRLSFFLFASLRRSGGKPIPQGIPNDGAAPLINEQRIQRVVGDRFIADHHHTSHQHNIAHDFPIDSAVSTENGRDLHGGGLEDHTVGGCPWAPGQSAPPDIGVILSSGVAGHLRTVGNAAGEVGLWIWKWRHPWQPDPIRGVHPQEK